MNARESTMELVSLKPTDRDEATVASSHSEESSLLLHARGNNTVQKPRKYYGSTIRLYCCIPLVVVTAILLTILVLIPEQSEGSQIARACNVTRYPETCIATVTGKTARGLTAAAVTAATTAVSAARAQAVALGMDPAVGRNATSSGLVDDCQAALGLALQGQGSGSPNSLSGALTLTGYCADGLTRVSGAESLRREANLAFQIVSNALALVNALAAHGEDLEHWAPTYFLAANARRDASAPPPSRRRLLWIDQSRVLDPNVTVALDGSGNHTSIQAAVNAAPVNSSSRFVIHIKAGVYDEIVRVPTSRTNLMFLGDGINRTIITGNLSVQVPGITTFKSATVGVEGEGFLAKAITFRNTAGAVAQQAVALRVSADKCALYQCSVEGFQDTLWAQAFRQFYKECIITGTVDFVFGNAAAVLQDCTLLARNNLPGKHNVYTAQGRYDPGQCTGFLLHNCTLDGTPDLHGASLTPPITYLGRPWKPFSLTVISHSFISALLHPSGWLPWSGDFALDTLLYGEYSNTGPGANTEVRVNWSTTITHPSVFSQLQPSQFLAANSWLPSAGIPFTDSL